MKKQPTEVEHWRDKADEYRREATELGTAVIELEAEVQQLLARIAELEAADSCNGGETDDSAVYDSRHSSGTATTAASGCDRQRASDGDELHAGP